MSTLKVNNITSVTSGPILRPNHPMFSAKGNDQQSADINGVVVSYDTAVFDRGNNYDTSNSKFTAPVTGIYEFHATVMFTSTNLTSYGYCFLDFRINGTRRGQEVMMPRPSGASFSSAQITDLISLSANDEVDVSCIVANTTLTIRNDFRHFYGRLIG